LREALAFGLASFLAYAALAALFFHRAPRLFERIDQVFDADLGLLVVDLTRRQGPHARTHVHPLLVLIFNPLGSTLRELLSRLGVQLAGRLAAALVCAAAGGAAVGAFRLLLHRLGVRPSLARACTLVFGLSAAQIVFSSLPESFALSALSLILVFVVAAGPQPAEASRTAAGVACFGINVVNLAAVTLARAAGFDWPGNLRRALLATARHVGLVLLLAGFLGVVQRALYPTAKPFFAPEQLAPAYRLSLVDVRSARELAVRAADVASHLGYVCLAAPRVVVLRSGPYVAVDFPPAPVRSPRPAGAVHAAVWTALLLLAARGLVRHRPPRPAIVTALLLWLAFEVVFHFFYGTSLFLYSGEWTFAIVAVAATGLETEASASSGRARGIGAALLLLAALQLGTNSSLLLDVLRVFVTPS
jgi:hypothetical protein